VYGTFATVTFVGVAGAVLFAVALLISPWSPIFAAVIALIGAVILLLVMSRLRQTKGKAPPSRGSLTESGQEAEADAGAVTESPVKQRPGAPGAR
jgi:membrane protein implicated in regulation of membrane protease activity